jgi:hypothetical protein
MNTNPCDHRFSVAEPINCRIRVRGYITPGWTDRFEGLAISTTSTSQAPPVTTLQGVLSDQAALIGALNSLHDLRLPVVSVECLDTLPDEETDAPMPPSIEDERSSQP